MVLPSGISLTEVKLAEARARALMQVNAAEKLCDVWLQAEKTSPMRVV